jgi:hypothetical protein
LLFCFSTYEFGAILDKREGQKVVFNAQLHQSLWAASNRLEFNPMVFNPMPIFFVGGDSATMSTVLLKLFTQGNVRLYVSSGSNGQAGDD